MSIYKRKLTEKTLNFYPPEKECFACYDTGIVSNSDGLINNLYWSNYDIDENGKRFAGSDLSIICHCKKSYQQLDDAQNVINSGYRDSFGNIKTVQTVNGEQALGISLSKDQTREIHNQRKQKWKETVETMNKYRIKNNKNKTKELPYFIETVKENLNNIESLFSFPTEKATVDSMKSNKSDNLSSKKPAL